MMSSAGSWSARVFVSFNSCALSTIGSGSSSDTGHEEKRSFDANSPQSEGSNDEFADGPSVHQERFRRDGR